MSFSETEVVVSHSMQEVSVTVFPVMLRRVDWRDPALIGVLGPKEEDASEAVDGEEGVLLLPFPPTSPVFGFFEINLFSSSKSVLRIVRANS